MAGPTVHSRRLGTELRLLRQAAQLDLVSAMEPFRWSVSKGSRMETGKVPVKERDLRDLLKLYKVDDQETIARLVELARRTRTTQWWNRYYDTIPSWFEGYQGLEADASKITIYELALVPGPLQTDDYSRTIFEAHYDESEELGAAAFSREVARKVEFRAARRRALENSVLEVFLDEAVLCRPVGSRRIMLAQFDFLLKAAERETLHLHVLPFSEGCPIGISFARIEFADGGDPVFYVEELADGVIVQNPGAIRVYEGKLARLRAHALDQVRSREMINLAKKEL